MNLSCSFHSRLAAFLAGQLAPDDESLIEDHVDGCASCQRQLEELTANSAQAPLLSRSDEQFEEPMTPRLRQNVVAAFSEQQGRYFYVTESDDPPEHCPADELPNVPGYEVSGLLGRGGIGVVYRAVDQKLKRSVALKIIRQQASPSERERLQREAEALATMRHPGVVQIHEIGEIAGRPFLALEYVAGGSLSRYLNGKPQPPRAAARLVATLAETMEQAHHHGLVHRDLKPANVLLQWDKESRLHDDLNYCRPKVTDFGLVKNMSVESGLTHSRDLLGTPSYMAPEQAGGDPESVGPACDIWALGAILYELLTGRPPFHGATAVDTMMQVRQTEPVPPCRLQPKLPRDLQTICLKCLEKSPALRYASARELADDLHRFRDGQSIQARPVSSAGKAWRWCCRNPALSAIAAVAAALLMVLAIGGPTAAYREAALRREANERAEQAEAERMRAGQNLDLATLALEESLKRVYERVGVRPDTLYDFDQRAWEATVPYLEQIVEQEADTPDLRLRRARATRQLAKSVADRGQMDRSSDLFRRAIADVAELAKVNDVRADLKRELGVSHLEFGKHLMSNRKTAAEGEVQLRLAVDQLEGVAASNPKVAGYREDLANTLGYLGEWMMRDKVRRTEAHGLLTKTAALRRGLTEEFPQNRAYLSAELFPLLSLGALRSDLGDHSQAIEVFERAKELGRRLSTSFPGDPQFLYLQAASCDGLAVANMKYGQIDTAVGHAQEATAIHDRLANAFPAAKQFAYSAMQSHELFRTLLAQQEKWPAAAEQSRIALAIIKKYSEANPRDKSAKINLVYSTRSLGDSLQKLGQPQEAAEEYRRAISVGDPLMTANSDEPTRRAVAEAFAGLGEVLASQHDHKLALSQFDRSVELASPAGEMPTSREMRRVLKRALKEKANVHRALGQQEDADKAQTRSDNINDQE